jgi:hypothetical protein
VICSTKTLVDFYETTQHYISADRTPHSHCRESLKSDIVAMEKFYFAIANIKDLLSVLSVLLCTPREVY